MTRSEEILRNKGYGRTHTNDEMVNVWQLTPVLITQYLKNSGIKLTLSSITSVQWTVLIILLLVGGCPSPNFIDSGVYSVL